MMENNYSIKFGAIGGLDENGKNCYILEVDGDIFIIEAGLKYPDSFSPGVEFLIPNTKYLEENKSKVKAIIVTHGHDDVFGGLPYLLETIDVPCYLTKTTLAILTSDYESRFDLKKFKFITINPSDEINIAGHKFSLFSTTHSASDSFGFVLRTEQGNIIYTGDFITDYNDIKHHSFNFSKVASIANEKNALLLLTDSSSADKIGICSPNHKLTPHIKSLIEEQNNRLFIALYSQNFYSIQEVIDLAVANDKKLVLVNERFKKALPEINKTGTLMIPKNNIINSDEIIRYSSKDIIVMVLGTGQELFDLITSLSNGSYLDKNVLIEENDTVLLACPSVPGTEKIATETLDATYQTGAKIINLTRKDLFSMHPHEEDLKMMLSLFRPKYYFPVKGEYRLLMENAKIALSTDLGFNYSNVLLLDNGMLVKFDKNGKLLPDIEKFDASDLVVTGQSVAKKDAKVLLERQKLADDGILCLSVIVSSKQQRVLSLPEIQSRGFIYLGDQQNIMQDISNMFNETIHELMAHKMMSTQDAEKKLIDKLSKYLTKQIRKTPYLDINIINIDEKEE